MKNRKETELISKMQKLAQSYVPEWKFSLEDPDPGSVLSLLCCDMIEENRKRFAQVLHKHKIQYLNLFDRLKEEPIESARTYVQFSAVTGLDEPVLVPKGTRLFAETEEDGQRIVFETVQNLTVSPAELQSIYATDKSTDCIAELMAGDTNPEKAQFLAFDVSAENQAEHVFLLGFDHAFDQLTNLELSLKIVGANDEDAVQAAETLKSSAVDIVLLTPQGEEHFDRIEQEECTLRLFKKDYLPAKVELEGKQRYVLAFRANELCRAVVSGFELSFSRSDIQADEVYFNGIIQNAEHFQPFGKPMEIYAECGIECRELFARHGAEAEMSFDLSFETLEQKLPEIESQVNYKVIMKQPPVPARPVTVEIKPDYVLLEYFGENGWKRLIRDEQAALLFNGSVTGTLKFKFKVPDDMVSAEENPGEYRLRLRLLRADHLYQIPSIQYCPVIDHLRFSYSYNDSPVLPDYGCTKNNFEDINVTDQLTGNRKVELFYNHEAEKTAMYFGFNAPLWGSPVSLYFEIENDEDCPVDFTAEYLSESGFSAIKIVDHTDGMLYSGAMLTMIPKDIQHKMLFGKDLYWIRLVRHDRLEDYAALPLIKGIYTNMAQVENHRTQVETFYVDNVDASVQIQLAERDIIHAEVFVNEEGAAECEDGEHWVRWEKGKFYSRQGRIYEIDLAAGQISFERNIFALYPLDPHGPAIKVEYQSYQGTDANVPANAINTLSESIRYISRVHNPIAAYGGYDGYNEETSARIIANMLRTRGRAITEKDYFDLISQVSYGVRRIKCCNGIDQYGAEQPDAITIAVLIDEYEQGSHIFSVVKDRIREKLLESSSIIPLGKELILSQPYFVQLSVRMWLECERMENAYDLQKQSEELISAFIDPLHGGFEGNGWEIGVLPTMHQILAFLKIRLPQAVVTRTVMTATFGRNEHAVNDEIYKQINNPFAMAVNGEHIIYVNLKE